jgi:hypothetical protein
LFQLACEFIEALADLDPGFVIIEVHKSLWDLMEGEHRHKDLEDILLLFILSPG